MNNKRIVILTLLVTVLALTFCKRDEEEDPEVTEPGPTATYDDTPYEIDYGLMPIPDFGDNPLTVSGVQLGRMLFYEKELSLDNSISCASCHRQDRAFADPNQFSEGVDGTLGRRQAMAVFNTAWHRVEFFWDGRAHTLREQSLMPIEDQAEMKDSLDNVIAKLEVRSEYRDQFIRAFGDDEITAERMSLALEQFMNSIVSNRSKYDKYLAGEVELSEAETRGKDLFFGEFNPFFPESSGADCFHCHNGPNLDGDFYANNGLDGDRVLEDLGREEVTGLSEDALKFKAPSLRNIELTAPYMHDGRLQSLGEVMGHYNSNIKDSETLDPVLKATLETGLLLSTNDAADILQFLLTLTDEELITDERYSSPFDE